MIAYDQTVDGELTSPNGTEHRFTGCRNEVVKIAVTAGDFSPRIELYSADDADPLATATAIGRTVVLASTPLPASGPYTLVVSGRSRSSRGDYSLTLDGTGPEGTVLSDLPTPLNLSLGQVVTGTLPAARVDQWHFRGCVGDAIRAEISSDGFAPKLSLFSPHAERPIATAEAGVGMTAAFSRTLPESGVFVLAAGGAGGTDTGDYTLALTLESAATPTATIAPTAAPMIATGISTSTSTSTVTVISEVPATITPTAAPTATPTSASGPRVRRGVPTPKAEPSPTRQATAHATATATAEMIMPGMGEGAFRIVDLYSVGGPVNHIIYAPDGDTFASAGEDGVVRLWNSLRGNPVDTLLGHEGPVNYLAYAPGGELLASAGEDGTVRLWDSAGLQAAQLDMRGSGVNSVAFSPDGRELVATSESGDVFVWDVAQETVRLALLGHEAPVYHAGFSPDGKRIATGDAAGVVRIWDVSSGAVRQTLPVNRGPGSGDPILSVVFSRDSSTVVVGSVIGVNQASVQLWDITTGDPIREFVGHEEWGSSALFSPDEAYIISAGRADPAQEGPSPATTGATVRLWDASSGALRIALLGFSSNVVAATFRPDGDELLTSDGASAYIWPGAMVKVLAAAYAAPVGVHVPVVEIPDAEISAQPGNTPTATSTLTPTPTRTAMPTVIPTATPTPTPIEVLTPTFLPLLANVEIYCTVTAQNLNLRSGPGTAFDPPLTLLGNGALLKATGRNADSNWLQVAVLNDSLEEEISGWVSANFVFCTGDLADLGVVEGE
jgi:hypothetical protein